MTKQEAKAITEIIKKLEALVKAKEEYRERLIENLKNEIDFDIDDIRDCIIAHTLRDDSFGGYNTPTATTFETNLIRDVRSAIKSPEPEDTNDLIRHLKTVKKRGEKAEKQAKPQSEPHDTKIPMEPKKRKSHLSKVTAIAAFLESKPNAKSPEVERATGIDESDVRHIWGPIRKALKNGKSNILTGSKNNGTIDAEDKSASCQICRVPLSQSFECKFCNEIIVGECKTCHYTNQHPEEATP